MTAEPLTALLVSKPALSGELNFSSGYYRSRLFVVPVSNNPLAAAAGPLFSLLERLCVSPSLPPVAALTDNISHELRAFHSRLHGREYAAELDIIAHFLLCATIDELVGKSYLRLYGKAPEFKAFTPLSSDNTGPQERFFDIVNYIRERPNQYLDLIELAYYCLIAGFEGMHHQSANGRLALDNCIEDLFQLIQQYRVNKSYQLFHESKKNIPQVHKQRPLFLTGALAAGLLLAAWLLSFSLLDNKARSIQSGHAVITQPDG